MEERSSCLGMTLLGRQAHLVNPSKHFIRWDDDKGNTSKIELMLQNAPMRPWRHTQSLTFSGIH